ncbi:MAG TPA: efflux RND transporter periplasmic adaptor subunit [Longimicrobiales bacterium]|nr:efflux RND transporter periplasmic adaptor subunit [Longimicrobiales bacterium]
MKLVPMMGAVTTAVLLAACGGNNDEPQTAQASPGGGPGGMMGGGGARVVVVEVEPASRGNIARQVTVSGVVEPVRVVGVNSQLAGAVNAVQVQEGDRVRAGTVLARMDSREIEAQLASAQASFDVAKAAYERAEQLRERRVITLPEYERERTAYAAAQAQVEQLRTRVGYATVRAPVTGVITDKNVEAGDVVGNQARLFTIADDSELVARVGVSELDVVELDQGDPVTITLDAFPNQALAGRIRRVFPSADPTTRLVPVEVVFDAQSARFARPGFLARVTFDLATSQNVLLLPVQAVLGAQGSQAVFIVDDESRAQRRPVVTGLTSRGRVEIVSGIDDGDPVIVIGNANLREGMTVRVAGRDQPQSLGDPTPASAGAVPAETGTTGGDAAAAAVGRSGP